MKMSSFALPVIALSLLAGCGPATLGELRDTHTPDQRMAYTVNTNYETAYRTVLTNARRCWQRSSFGANWVVQGELYPSTQTSEVAAVLQSASGSVTHVGVDMVAQGPNATKVTVYVGVSSSEPAGQAVRGWLERGSTECRV